MHVIMILIHLMVKAFGQSSRNNYGVLSQAEQDSLTFWQRRQDLGDLTGKTKDQFIMAFGEPDKIKNMDQGMQRLTWKGKKFRIVIDVNAVDQFDRIEEAYT